MPTETPHDYSDHIAQPSEAHFARLNEAVSRLTNEEAEVERLENELKAAKMRAGDIAERELPELMQQMGLEEFKTTSGVKISIKESVHASISKAKHARAMKWLEDNGHAGVIKRRIEVAFDRDQQEEAASAMGTLVDLGLDAAENMSVHPSTLKALVRELLESGAPLDQDLLGVHLRKVAKVE